MVILGGPSRSHIRYIWHCSMMETDEIGGHLARHLESRFSLGSERATPTPYRPNYPLKGQYINEQHAFYVTAPRNRHLIDLGIPGWLRVEDALKLYELAYFSTGNVLELGTNRGLSTSILARALIDAGRGHRLTTIDIQPSFIDQAKAELEERKLDDVVDFLCGDAATFLEQFEAEGTRFGFAFIDHSHAYEPVLRACQALGQLLLPGSFALFHDYTDRRNTLRRNIGESGEEYGVFAAIQDGLSQDMFEFYGCYGCCGLFYRH